MNRQTSRVTLITKSDIAEIAGVGRSTVSNWTSRHKDDFPAPIAGTSTSPRYDEAAVIAWLNSRGRAVRQTQVASALWSALDGWRGFARPEDTSELAGSLITWRFLTDPASPGFDEDVDLDDRWPALTGLPDEQLVRRLRDAMERYDARLHERGPLFENAWRNSMLGSLAARPDVLRTFLEALDTIDPDRLGHAYESFQDRLTTSVRRGYDENATSDRLVDLLVAASASVPGPVHDPAVGSGRLLLAVADHGQAREPLTGGDLLETVCAHARQRAVLQGRQVTIRNEDAFTGASAAAEAAVVVLDPPFGLGGHQLQRFAFDPRLRFGVPPVSSLDTGWLQLAVWHLREGGRAFVLQPPASSFRGGREAEIRAEMVKAGAIEAIVALPGGLAARTSIPVNLWVLARPGESADPSRVLLIDQSADKDLDVSAIADALQAWRRHGAEPQALPSVALSVDDLAAEQFNLSPQRWLAVADPAPTLAEIRTHLDRLVANLDRVRRVTAPASATVMAPAVPPRMATIKELEQSGVLSVIRPRAQSIRDLMSTEGTPVITSRWVREGTDTDRLNAGVLSAAPELTQAGDVLVQLVGTVAARVDVTGGRLAVDANTCLLRITSNDLDPHYLAAMLPTRANNSVMTGATIKRAPVSGLKIPVVPIGEQRQVARTFEDLDVVEDAARAAGAAAAATRSALVEAVAAGTAVPGTP